MFNDELWLVYLFYFICCDGGFYNWPLFFSAVGEALKLASTISQFPQKCMRADRLSAHYVTYDAKSYEDAFDFEWKNGHKVFLEESVHGKFNTLRPKRNCCHFPDDIFQMNKNV